MKNQQQMPFQSGQQHDGSEAFYNGWEYFNQYQDFLDKILYRKAPEVDDYKSCPIA
jgi:hypothetical protein